MFQSWFNTYTSELFIKQAETIKSMLFEKYADSNLLVKNKMMRNVVLGAKLEYQFWDDAYNQ